MMGLVNRMRAAILEGEYGNFCRTFLSKQFPNSNDVPDWVEDALMAAGVPVIK
jgi:hypothetical protein